MAGNKYGNRFDDLANKRFGRLVAIKRISPVGQKKVKWVGKWEWGKEVEAFGTYVQVGDTQSCGCLKKDLEDKHLREKYEEKRIDGVAMQLFKGKEPRKDSSTGYRGVTRYYTRKSNQERFRAWLTVKGKQYYKSGFKTAEDAYYNGRLALEDEHLPRKEREK